MLFNSQIFILGFLPVCLGGFFAAGRFLGSRWALAWLLLASLFFYGWWAPKFVFLLLGSMAGNFALGGVIARLTLEGRQGHAGRRLAAGIVVNLALLGWFKYADFVRVSFGAVVGIDMPTLNLFLPLAISFFTFQQILFLLDCRVRPGVASDGLSYACLVAFFPHLIAGPIVRLSEILPQFAAAGLARPDRENLVVGCTFFLLGLAKKLVLADMFGRFADVGFDAVAGGATLSLFEAWYAALAYALQIYFDFSGYSDMAIGLARMFNIRFPINFFSPYQAADISDFWRRWHISLSRFLRDTVYIPLGGNRRGEVRRQANLMATMLLGGLWHGAAWNFFLWGGLHGIFLVVFSLWRRAGWQRAGMRLPRGFGQGLTILAVVLAWVPFRAENFAAAWRMLHAMAGLDGVMLPWRIVESIPGLALLIDPVPVLAFLGDGRSLSFPEVTAALATGWGIVLLAPNVQALTERGRSWALTGSFALTVQALFFAPSVSPFLYFRF